VAYCIVAALNAKIEAERIEEMKRVSHFFFRYSESTGCLIAGLTKSSATKFLGSDFDSENGISGMSELKFARCKTLVNCCFCVDLKSQTLSMILKQFYRVSVSQFEVSRKAREPVAACMMGKGRGFSLLASDGNKMKYKDRERNQYHLSDSKTTNAETRVDPQVSK